MTTDYGELKCKNCGASCYGLDSLNEHEDFCSVTPEEMATRQREIEKELTWDDVADVLSLTVKQDKATKLINFACMLLSQTEEDQFNVGLQAESSTGKSYIPIMVADYFPTNEVTVIASASPTAFFHDRGTWDEERGVLIVDLESKILVFLDQPHFQLLEKLRPLLSHDRKELEYKITDKNQKRGLRTKNVILRGYPSVIFCTVRMDPDEQEKTRLFLLSPEIGEGKLRESIELLSLKKCNPDLYVKMLESNEPRKLLKERISAIRNSGIRNIIIPNSDKVMEGYKPKEKQLRPRDQRDFPRVISLIKVHALLNCFGRNRTDNETIEANEADINAGFALYREIATPNELGIPPYVYDVYLKIFEPLFKRTNDGIDNKAIEQRYFEVYHKPLGYKFFKEFLIVSLRSASLITEEPDPNDRRKVLYYPSFTKEKYIPPNSGVEHNTSDNASIDVYPTVPGNIVSEERGNTVNEPDNGTIVEGMKALEESK